MKQSRKKGGQVGGIIALSVLIITTITSFIPILFIGLLKLFPNVRWQAYCTQFADSIAGTWSAANNAYINTIQRIKWEITGVENLNPKDWYVVIANHQSWLDIVVLQYLFNRKIPVLKFFIKDQLKWVPLLGFSWWAMGCPFMKRYSKAYLEKKPYKKGKDLSSTKKALRLFKYAPTTIMNFVEGTRFSAAKNQQQQSPYTHLLKPKAGGLNFVLKAMGKQFNKVLDVTIVYPSNNYSLWDFLCNRVDVIKIDLRQLTLPEQFTQTSDIPEAQAQEEFRTWLNSTWLEKDKLIARFKDSCSGSM